MKPVGLLLIKHPPLCLPADVSFHKAQIRVSPVILLDYVRVLKLKPDELPRWFYRHLFVSSRTLNFAYLFFPYPVVLASLFYTSVSSTPFNETKDKSSMFRQRQIQPLPCALCHGQTMREPLLRFTPLHGGWPVKEVITVRKQWYGGEKNRSSPACNAVTVGCGRKDVIVVCAKHKSKQDHK